jgi:hypothetical protein
LTAGNNSTPITATFTLSPYCATDVRFIEDALGDKLDIQGKEIEVQFTGVASGILVYSRTTNTNGTDATDVITNCCYE